MRIVNFKENTMIRKSRDLNCYFKKIKPNLFANNFLAKIGLKGMFSFCNKLLDLRSLPPEEVKFNNIRELIPILALLADWLKEYVGLYITIKRVVTWRILY